MYLPLSKLSTVSLVITLSLLLASLLISLLLLSCVVSVFFGDLPIPLSLSDASFYVLCLVVVSDTLLHSLVSVIVTMYVVLWYKVLYYIKSDV